MPRDVTGVLLRTSSPARIYGGVCSVIPAFISFRRAWGEDGGKLSGFFVVKCTRAPGTPVAFNFAIILIKKVYMFLNVKLGIFYCDHSAKNFSKRKIRKK